VKFSERIGINEKLIQLKEVDINLRVSLWNYIFTRFLASYDSYINSGKIWMHCLNKPLDDFPLPPVQSDNPYEGIVFDEHYKKELESFTNGHKELKKQIKEFFMNCQWYEVYDVVECVFKILVTKENEEGYIKRINDILKSENAGYRFVDNKITPIIDEKEINEIKKAMNVPYSSVKIHLKQSHELLSNRTKPDYRNSIKEAISAVEALCKIITDKDKATLGQALKIIEKEIGIHSALKNAFSNLYGYTSDEDGIRHSLLDEPNIYFEDALFMLIACSSFINYLISKLSKLNPMQKE